VSAQVQGLEPRRMLSTNLVADMGGIYPTDSVTVAGVSYFTASHARFGRELWRSDGTAGGTVMVRDLTPGIYDSQIVEIKAYGSGIAFVVRSAPGASLLSLWKSNGTKTGTVKVADLPDDVFEHSLTAVGARLIFVTGEHSDMEGEAQANGVLWSSDGTAAGTRAIVQLDDYASPLNYHNPELVGGHALFATPYSMWSTDGTAAGTVRLTDGRGTGGWFTHTIVGPLHPGGDVMFWTTGQTSPTRLWHTDGTPAGTAEITLDVHPSQRGVVVGGYLYFGVQRFVDDGDGNGEHAANFLWRSDGTAAGTRELGRLVNFFSTDWVAGFGEKVIFGDYWVAALHPGQTPPAPATYDIYAFDATTGAFTLLRQFSQDKYLTNFISVGNAGFFLVTTGNVTEVWRSDGTPDGTRVIRTTAPGEWVSLTEIDGRLAISTSVTTYLVNPAEPDVTLEPNQGRVTFSGGILRVFGTRAADSVRIYQRTDDPTRFVVNLNGAARSYAYAAVSRIYVYGYSGDDNIAVVEKYGKFTVRSRIWGGAGDDAIYTGGARDTIYGDFGDDTINAGNNDDQLDGGDDADLITSGNGNDTATGGDGADRVNGNKGDDVLSGGNDLSDDTIDGSAGADVLFGTAVYEVFYAPGSDEDPLDEVLLA